MANPTADEDRLPLIAVYRNPNRPTMDGRICRCAPTYLDGTIALQFTAPGAPVGRVLEAKEHVDVLASPGYAGRVQVMKLVGRRVRHQTFDPVFPPAPESTLRRFEGVVIDAAGPDKVFVSWDYGVNPEQGRPAYLPATDLRVL